MSRFLKLVATLDERPVAHRLAQRSPVAVLIPEDISATAVPPFESRPDVIGWHSVRVCGKEIDFALLLPGIGLFVVEVKDWKHENILLTGLADFTLCTEEGGSCDMGTCRRIIRSPRVGR